MCWCDGFFVMSPDEDDSAEPDSDLIPDTLPNVQGDVYIPASRGGGGGGGGGAYVPPAAREGGAYVPPHMKRGGGGGGSGSYVPPGMRRGGWGRGGRGSRLPPDLSSAVAFPSLHDVANKGEGRCVCVECVACVHTVHNIVLCSTLQNPNCSISSAYIHMRDT